MASAVFIVFCLYIVCASGSSVPTWFGVDPLEDIVEDGIEDQSQFGSSHFQEDRVIFGPDLRENEILTTIIEPVQPEDVPEVHPNVVTSTEEAGSSSFGGPVDNGPKEDVVRSLNEKLDKLTSQIKDQEDRIQGLENANKRLLGKIDQVEQQTKMNNVILTNVRESKNENHKSTLHKVLHILNRMMKLRINADEISVALRVDGNSTSVRPIVVSFNRFATKMRVLGARNKLNKSIIDISADYSELVRQRRKELLPFLLEKRRQGHTAFIIYDWLMVDGVKMTLEGLQREKAQEETPREDEQVEESPEKRCGDDYSPVSQEPDEDVEEVEVYPEFEDDE